MLGLCEPELTIRSAPTVPEDGVPSYFVSTINNNLGYSGYLFEPSADLVYAYTRGS